MRSEGSGLALSLPSLHRLVYPRRAVWSSAAAWASRRWRARAAFQQAEADHDFTEQPAVSISAVLITSRQAARYPPDVPWHAGRRALGYQQYDADAVSAVCCRECPPAIRTRPEHGVSACRWRAGDRHNGSWPRNGRRACRIRCLPGPRDRADPGSQDADQAGSVCCLRKRPGGRLRGDLHPDNHVLPRDCPAARDEPRCGQVPRGQPHHQPI